jgi:nucleotide-binding universal stress UspA family protein
MWNDRARGAEVAGVGLPVKGRVKLAEVEVSAMFRKILVPVDGSQSALRAARIAAEIARKFDSQVTLLTVVEAPDTAAAAAGMAGMMGVDTTASPALEAAARELLGAAAQAMGLPDAKVRQVVVSGHAADIICEACRAGADDLIVMGSRGLSEVGSLFLGSVSDKVSHHAPCPVLIVR